MTNSKGKDYLDAVVVGAGFAGLYMLYKLRQQGMTVKLIEAASDVGGTWYWNRYPGARCDIVSIDYSYSFDAELQQEWQWTERYASQPEILSYINHVAERFSLRPSIQFDTRVTAAQWQDTSSTWRISTDAGTQIDCRYFIMATGCLSIPKPPELKGLDQYTGDIYTTGRWPHTTVDFTGKRVGVIGTGSSGIQVIPELARQASEVCVFQRTANFCIPSHNGPLSSELEEAFKRAPEEYREAARNSLLGIPGEMSWDSAMAVSSEERLKRYEDMWQEGTLKGMFAAFGDVIFNPAANEAAANFVRDKIRNVVNDATTAEGLCPHDHPFLTKRPCLGNGYFEAFNQPNVRLIDLKTDPIDHATSSGIKTQNGEYILDALVFATGFDAFTGAVLKVNISGRDGTLLSDAWAEGANSYMGLAIAGFPNFFMVTGPGSPAVLSNMLVSIEQHVEWISDCLKHMTDNDYHVVEATLLAQQGWQTHVLDAVSITLYPEVNSWYFGTNVSGKPRMFLPFIGGVDAYRNACNDIVKEGYLGFHFEGKNGQVTNDGVIRSLRPDVQKVLDIIDSIGLPRLESLHAIALRAVRTGLQQHSPPGPQVGEILDGQYSAAETSLAYRLYRPPTEGPHPAILYYHGGGWVTGGQESDDAFCRDLCLKANALVVSCDYRHAPETRFPGAHEDAFAALRWVAENIEGLGGIPEKIAVAGWNAGANLAASAAIHARDNSGPDLVGQLLITPLVDSDFNRSSYRQNELGPMLSTEMVQKYWDAYIDQDDRLDPRIALLESESLSGLPPGMLITSQFDPVRDEGTAYAQALANAGVEIEHLDCRGQMHTSYTMVGMVLSGEQVRKKMAELLSRLFFATDDTKKLAISRQ